MKRVYVAEVLVKDADRFEIAICDSMEKALDAIENDKDHTTSREAKTRTWAVSAWDIPLRRRAEFERSLSGLGG